MTNVYALSLSFICAATQLFAQAGHGSSACPSLSEERKQSITAYVRTKYKISDRVVLKLTSDEKISDTCFRRLTFAGTSGIRDWTLSLYLSPDLRFITDKLYDTQLSPEEEDRRDAERLTAAFVSGTVPTLGPPNAPVTIVEFSDFECPFCAKFDKILKEVLATGGDGIRVVFHHFPLQMHPWAQDAAAGATCALLQSNDNFWALHDKLFENQAAITSGNVQSRIREYASAVKTLDLSAFDKCLSDSLSLGLVFRDTQLAASNHVTATPTLFINGRRVAGVKDAAELRSFIEQARADASRQTPNGGKVEENR